MSSHACITQHAPSPVVCWQGRVTEAILVIFPCAPHVQTSETGTGTADQQLHQDYSMGPSGQLFFHSIVLCIYLLLQIYSILLRFVMYAR